jgi:4-aminobutyrate aminotransferase-like enzyme
VIAICADVENSIRMGSYLIGRLGQMKEKPRAIGNVHTLGSMVAAEFAIQDARPESETVHRVRMNCLDRWLSKQI